MSKSEIEKLLLNSVEKLNQLENSHNEKVIKLESKIEYLEEMISSQKTMLNDTVMWIKKHENDTVNEKEA